MDIFQIAQKLKDVFIYGKEFLFSIDWLKVLILVRFIFIITSIILFVGIIILIIKTNLLLKTKQTIDLLTRPTTKTSGRLLKKWRKIEKRLKSSQEIEWKIALIEADKFFDNILKKMGYFGKNMSERLGQVSAEQISNIEEIKEVHRIRNEIVYKSDYRLSKPVAEKSIRAIKKALKELEVL